jgi:hypothetical protein
VLPFDLPAFPIKIKAFSIGCDKKNGQQQPTNLKVILGLQ